MQNRIPLLIIGAGPFGLAMSAHAKYLGIEHVIVGKTMEFWKENMPEGMLLRSDCHWHLDPENEHTINKFLELNGLTYNDVEPLSVPFYLSYVQWFIEKKQIKVLETYVQKLDEDANGFTAYLDNGTTIHAKFVVIAIGLQYFQFVPGSLSKDLPRGSYTHSCDFVDMKSMKNKRVLILGGRQSAFEWAALSHEAGAKAVYLSYRHDTPQFTQSDWEWVNPIIDHIAEEPTWFRKLSLEEQENISKKLWAEGRLKLEPWLAKRIKKDTIKLLPSTRLLSCVRIESGELKIMFDKAPNITADHIILATGFKVNVRNVPFLRAGNISAKLSVRNDFPEIDEYFQTNIPGLFITSMAAGQDFGPFFGFTIAVRTSAKLIGKCIMESLSIPKV
jgi:lysine/ornithine N-monooxygenase